MTSQRILKSRCILHQYSMSELSKSLTGIAGAHFVAGELSQRGYIATLTPRNTRGIDVLVSKLDGSKSVSIQVKTSSAKQRENYTRSWSMGKKDENIFSDYLFYVFVDIKNNNEKPDYYIVKSKTVADYVKTTHKDYLTRSGGVGKPHLDAEMRAFVVEDSDVDNFLNRWDTLGLD
jgi:hypothetical protein